MRPYDRIWSLPYAWRHLWPCEGGQALHQRRSFRDTHPVPPTIGTCTDRHAITVMYVWLFTQEVMAQCTHDLHKDVLHVMERALTVSHSMSAHLSNQRLHKPLPCIPHLQM